MVNFHQFFHVEHVLGPGESQAAVDTSTTSTTSTSLAQSISSAAEGVATWRQRLSLGRIWRDEEGANWPQEPTLRGGWQDLLREKGGEKMGKVYFCVFFNGELVLKGEKIGEIDDLEEFWGSLQTGGMVIFPETET